MRVTSVKTFDDFAKMSELNLNSKHKVGHLEFLCRSGIPAAVDFPSTTPSPVWSSTISNECGPTTYSRKGPPVMSLMHLILLIPTHTYTDHRTT
jgi:hypothetical protein